jgi:hypothetical protein
MASLYLTLQKAKHQAGAYLGAADAELAVGHAQEGTTASGGDLSAAQTAK